MTDALYVHKVSITYRYTHEATDENDNAYLREEQCDDFDQFDDNDFQKGVKHERQFITGM